MRLPGAATEMGAMIRAKPVDPGGPGVAAAARVVAEDVSALVKAELALAKAEAMVGIRAKAGGIGALVGAGVCAWLGLQGLLITAAFALALVVPGWVAALIVTLVLLALAAGAGVIGKKMLAVPVSVAVAKTNLEEDVAWAKAHLTQRPKDE